MLKTVTIHKFSTDTFLTAFDGLTISEASKQILLLNERNNTHYSNVRFRYQVDQEYIEVLGDREESREERLLRVHEEKERLLKVEAEEEYKEFLRLQMKFAGVKTKFWEDTVPTKSCSLEKFSEITCSEGGFKAGELQIIVSGDKVGKSMLDNSEPVEVKQNHLVDKYRLNE